jgi:diacylglycerol kinase (ATP)
VNNEVKKVLFIINKFSGGSFHPAFEGKIIDACEQQGLECSIEFTKNRGHATELSREVVSLKTFDLVVAVGGDGTVNEVAQGLLRSAVPMAILPKGSGNGLARHLGISMDLTKSMKALFSSQVIEMDTFTLNGRLSLNVSGIGFDGHVANLFKDSTKRGLQGYAKVTINEFVRFKEFEAEITMGEKQINRKGFIVAIANSSQYGNNARIAPAASVCDELLHVCFLKKVPAYRLDFIYNFFAGKIEETSFCEIMESRNMTIKVNTPVAFHIDGEPCGVDTEFKVEILPASLKMMVPTSSLKY